MNNPYRAPGRDVTDADRVEPTPPPSPPSHPLTERMIAAHKEARLRSHGRDFDLAFILSNAARADFEMEHAAGFYERAMAAVRSDPSVVVRSRRRCGYIGSLRGIPVFVDPEMLGGWTAEMEYR